MSAVYQSPLTVCKRLVNGQSTSIHPPHRFPRVKHDASFCTHCDRMHVSLLDCRSLIWSSAYTSTVMQQRVGTFGAILHSFASEPSSWLRFKTSAFVGRPLRDVGRECRGAHLSAVSSGLIYVRHPMSGHLSETRVKLPVSRQWPRYRPGSLLPDAPRWRTFATCSTRAASRAFSPDRGRWSANVGETAQLSPGGPI
jgi:hypothetical protein